MKLSTVPGLAIGVVLALMSACGAEEPEQAASTSAAGGTGDGSTSAPGADLHGEVDIGGGRTLYVRCTGTGAPTVVLEGGDGDNSSSYRFAEARIAAVTRTCVYDRANLGQSDPAPGPRGLQELVGDLEQLFGAAGIPGPYVLVGTSGGGYISVGYAVAHPQDVAGIVLVETPAPFLNPPPEIIDETRWDHPDNRERRDYLQVEKDAWAARAVVGNVPVTIISNDYGPDAAEAERSNVEDQRGWLVLSPRAQQIVVTTGHAVEERDPELVIQSILDVVEAAG